MSSAKKIAIATGAVAAVILLHIISRRRRIRRKMRDVQSSMSNLVLAGANYLALPQTADEAANRLAISGIVSSFARNTAFFADTKYADIEPTYNLLAKHTDEYSKTADALDKTVKDSNDPTGAAVTAVSNAIRQFAAAIGDLGDGLANRV